MKIQNMRIIMIFMTMMIVDTIVIVIVEYLACMILSTHTIVYQVSMIVIVKTKSYKNVFKV